MIIRQTTKEILAESLKELSTQKPIDKITIKEISANCGVTSKTFYNHFQDKYALIAWIYSTQAEKIFSKLYGENYTWNNALTDVLSYFLENKKFLRNLVLNTSGQDSFIVYLSKFSVKIFSDYIKRTQNLEKIPQDLEILINVYCYGVVCTLCEFLISSVPISDKEFVKQLERALPEPLKKYFYKN